jgi:hypothetical protein
MGKTNIKEILDDIGIQGPAREATEKHLMELDANQLSPEDVELAASNFADGFEAALK